MSASRRIEVATAGLSQAIEGAEGGEPSHHVHQLPTTAVGGLVAARDAMAQMSLELNELRRRLERDDGSMSTVRLDPGVVLRSRWCNRSDQSFESPAFNRLKADIAAAGGNLQPILVREVADNRYEIAFGHRRHRACQELGLPVLAVIWSGHISDVDLFIAMDRENRERVNPSAFEQGTAYAAALAAGLFPSQRRLAEAMGVSHTWVNKAIAVASLPTEIIRLLGGALRVRPQQATAIGVAIAADPAGFAERAAVLAALADTPRASAVLAALVGRPIPVREGGVIDSGGRQVATWRRDRSGRVLIALASDVIGEAAIARVTSAICSAFADEQVDHGQV